MNIPVSTVKNIWRWHQEDGYVERCSIYQDLLIPKENLDAQYHGKMKQSVIFGVTEPTLDAASVTVGQRKKVTAVTFFRCPTVSVAPHQLEESYGADNDVVVTGLVVQCGHNPDCAASQGA